MVVLPGSLALTWLWKQTSVASGSLALSHAPRWPPADDPDLDKKKTLTKYLGAGSGFGELALLYNDKRSATIKTTLINADIRV